MQKLTNIFFWLRKKQRTSHVESVVILEKIREEFRQKYDDKLKKKLEESKNKEENITEIIKDNVKVVNKKNIRNKKVSRKK